MIIKISNSNIKEIKDSELLKNDYIQNALKNDPFGTFLIMYDEEELVGYIYFSNIYDRAEINQIEVSEKRRGNGFGSKLLEEALKELNKDITLEVRENNFVAINLYEKYNFKKVAIRKGYYNGIDGILMERKNK